ncbi:MarR family winged helix-turn-helix transcriptional regulator [Allokutzneria sp. A3M-2-11 16]|uniref:MarR family winged helix-turn-helix transcriptional regulator n=1 Tax=Allokutzneria sp. A3M-2-11 16 TaxID=2962043 RepID=UPI0020B670F2|nr:MarR family winged helix-turn-helix transcriptional regulator [Allokutzneria sp. A3M-2-11 16]MCP3801667.1 MarR family winged helix-turn-helix transcriptional regulator [Allokutzneria sp. A3M-2-11 16]
MRTPGKLDNVVDEKVNQVVELRNPPGFELPLLLFAGFRSIIDRLHAELAAQGHPDVRPAYGFAMQAIGVAGATASELGRRLGVSKQAAGKTVDRLVALGYAERADDAADARRKLVRLTPRGLDSLARSAAIFDELRAHWEKSLGAQQLQQVESALRTMAPADGFRLDAASWFGA